MREILFRGKRVDNGEWVYGSFIPDSMEIYYGDKDLDGFIKPFGETKEERVMVEVERNTVGQYTGLKDKNGTRIFEGDIVICDYFCGVVNFYEGTWCVTEEDNYPEYLYDVIDLKIIGNIHDNPELLKGEQKNETTT